MIAFLNTTSIVYITACRYLNTPMTKPVVPVYMGTFLSIATVIWKHSITYRYVEVFRHEDIAWLQISRNYKYVIRK